MSCRISILKWLRSYYFMEGGVAAYYDEMKADFTR